MKFRPRFSLRTLFIAITLISLTLGFVTYNLNWIQQRRNWWVNGGGAVENPYSEPSVRAPGMLWLFGEQGAREFDIGYPAKIARTDAEFWSLPYVQEGRRLFPEAKITGHYIDEHFRVIHFSEESQKVNPH